MLIYYSSRGSIEISIPTMAYPVLQRHVTCFGHMAWL